MHDWTKSSKNTPIFDHFLGVATFQERPLLAQVQYLDPQTSQKLGSQGSLQAPVPFSFCIILPHGNGRGLFSFFG